MRLVLESNWEESLSEEPRLIAVGRLAVLYVVLLSGFWPEEAETEGRTGLPRRPPRELDYIARVKRRKT
jgi:hypothetical protein